MSQNEVVKALRMAVKQNKSFNAVCHVFALRERFRKQVTVRALQYKMKLEGFHYTRQEYENVVKFMASLGLGDIKTDKKQNPIGIFNLKKPLRAIGRAALGELEDLRLPVKQEPTKPPVWQRNIYPSVLTVFVGQKPINVNLAPTLSKDEVKAVVEKFADNAMGITTIVNDKPVEMTIQKGASSEEIASIVKRIQGRVIGSV